MGSVVSSSVPVEPGKMSTAGFKFWEDGISDIQQKAKSMSQQFLNSSPVADNSSLSGITSWLEKMTNQAANRQDTLYQRQLDDGAYWAQQSARNKASADTNAFIRDETSKQNAHIRAMEANRGQWANNLDTLNSQRENSLQLAEKQIHGQLAAIGAQNIFQADENRYKRNFEREQSALQRASAERIGAMDAQSRVYSSMFGSFSNAGNNNYQYWGGRV